MSNDQKSFSGLLDKIFGDGTSMWATTESSSVGNWWVSRVNNFKTLPKELEQISGDRYRIVEEKSENIKLFKTPKGELIITIPLSHNEFTSGNDVARPEYRTKKYAKYTTEDRSGTLIPEEYFKDIEKHCVTLNFIKDRNGKYVISEGTFVKACRE